jgi:hypothetical protein
MKTSDTYDNNIVKVKNARSSLPFFDQESF